MEDWGEENSGRVYSAEEWVAWEVGRVTPGFHLELSTAFDSSPGPRPRPSCLSSWCRGDGGTNLAEYWISLALEHQEMGDAQGWAGDNRDEPEQIEGRVEQPGPASSNTVIILPPSY